MQPPSRAPGRKRRYQPLDGLGPDGLPYRPRPSRTRLAFLAVSAALCALAGILYALQPDAGTALTVFPFWMWAAVGLTLLAFGAHRTSWRATAIITLAWLIALGAFAGEPRSLLRGMSTWPGDGWNIARRSGRAVRVVSLHRAGGDLRIAWMVRIQNPDIVLIQETPDRGAVDALARDLFGEDAGVAWGPGASIIARGRTSAAITPEATRPYETRARVTLADGPSLEVVSIRLAPLVVRTDLYRPGAWMEPARTRHLHRRQIQAVVDDLSAVPPDIPLLVGGDFGAPPRDAALHPLLARARDAFRQGGRGWGNTVPNELPALRVDQVWASPHFRAGSVRAHKSSSSEHRLVVADLWLDDEPDR